MDMLGRREDEHRKMECISGSEELSKEKLRTGTCFFEEENRTGGKGVIRARYTRKL